MAPLILGLTGGIGSGKSRVSDFLQQHYGIEVLDADVIARGLLQEGSAVLREVQRVFPQVFEDGHLQRSALRALIFADEAQRQRLNAIMHPAIRQALLLALQSASRRPYLLLSAPLLLENQLHRDVDAVCVLDVPEAVQRQRAARRDGVDEAAIEAIMERQWPRQKRLAFAHYVIHNADWQETEAQLHALHRHGCLLAAAQA